MSAQDTSSSDTKPSSSLKLYSILGSLLTLLSVAWALEIQLMVGLYLFNEQFLIAMLGVALTAIFIGLPAFGEGEKKSVPAYDWVLAALAIACTVFIYIKFPDYSEQQSDRPIDGLIVAFILAALVLEALRRTVGNVLVIVTACFIIYGLLGQLIPGELQGRPVKITQLAYYLIWDGGSMLGTPVLVASTIVIAFVLFGFLLFESGGSDFFTDVSLALMGRYRGGSAKIAVTASGLFGSISGSAVSNVMSTGVITIPLMRQGGYRAQTAGAIEAVASTGGQLMPPVMGITAFLIAEYLNLPYGDIVIAAAVPAFLYYLALFTQVDLEAGKLGLVGLPAEALPKLRNIMGRGWVFIIPIVVLLWTLVFENWSAGKSSVTAAVLTVIIGYFHPETRPTFKALVDGLVETGRTLMDLVVITAIAGIVIGVLQVSGLGSNFSLVLITASGNSLFILLLMTAGVCIILGMGMPTGVIYMMLAVLVAPALKEFGVTDLAAHLFLFYFGSLSMITPPVCMATFAAAAIAKTDFWATGWAGVRLAIVAYIVPFAMVYQPALVMEGEWWRIVLGIATASIGVVVLCIGVAGYFMRMLTMPERAAFFLAGFLWMVTPARGEEGLILHLAAAVVTAALFWWVRRQGAASATPAQ